MYQSITTLRRLLTLAVISALLAACGGGSDDDDDSEAVSSIRLVNAISDAPELSFLINDGVNDEIATQLAFIQASTQQTLDMGDYLLDISYQLETIEEATFILEDSPFNLSDGVERSLILTGSVSSPQIVEIENQIFLFGVDDDDIADLILAPQVQFVHAAPLQGMLDFYLTDFPIALQNTQADATLSLGEHSPLINKQAMAEARFRITVAGEPNNVLYDSQEFALNSTSRTTYMALDHFGAGLSNTRGYKVTNSGIASFPNEEVPLLFRVTNLVADLPYLDFFFGDTNTDPVFEAIEYGATSSYQTFESIDTFLNVVPMEQSGNFVLQRPLSLASNSINTLYIMGQFTGDDAQVKSSILNDDNRAIANQIQVKFVHGSSSAGNIEIFFLRGGQSTDNTSPLFTTSSLGFTDTRFLDAGEYDLIIMQAGNLLLYGPDRFSLEAGNIYTLLVADAVGGGTPLFISLNANGEI